MNLICFIASFDYLWFIL